MVVITLFLLATGHLHIYGEKEFTIFPIAFDGRVKAATTRRGHVKRRASDVELLVGNIVARVLFTEIDVIVSTK